MNRLGRAAIIGILFSSSLFGAVWEHHPEELQKNVTSLPAHSLVLLEVEYYCYHKIFFTGNARLSKEDQSNLRNLVASFLYQGIRGFKRTDWQEPPVPAAEFKRFVDIGQMQGRTPAPTSETLPFAQLRQDKTFRRWAGQDLLKTIDSMQRTSNGDLMWEYLYQRFGLQFFTEQTCDTD